MRNQSSKKIVTGIAGSIVAASLFVAVPLFSPSLHAQSDNQPGRGQAVVTVLPSKGNQAPTVSQQQLSIKVNGKDSTVTRWQQFGPNTPVELVLLIDGAARTSLGTQRGDIQKFMQSLPGNTATTIAYMQNGQAVLAGPLTTDRTAALQGLRIPSGGVPGISASPYFCLSSLAQHWPSNNRQARREVVMVTDGVDYYDGALHYDPEDPYLQTAITDAVKAQLIVCSSSWRTAGRLDRTMAATDAGQNLLAQLTEATGGRSYWQGFGDPVSFQPYFEDIERRLSNQYEVGFMAPSNNKTQVETFRFKANAPGTKVDAPQQVLVLGSEIAGTGQ
jgi:hypothetical protein